MGKESIIFKAQNLHRNCERRCGGYKCEGHAHYPGRSVYLPLASAVVRRRDGWAEVSRGHNRLLDQRLKGRTCNRDWEPCTSMISGVADRRAKLFPIGEGGGQYPLAYPAGATRITAVQANSHEGPTWD
ncbi:MAG: hypothetical protein C0631_15295 [Sedimenticola sp.]|nr:MAG: hypothetical protein C0631_15295 [Sedimenticola sp.]